jgi:hypothetical protein
MSKEYGAVAGTYTQKGSNPIVKLGAACQDFRSRSTQQFCKVRTSGSYEHLTLTEELGLI